VNLTCQSCARINMPTLISQIAYSRCDVEAIRQWIFTIRNIASCLWRNIPQRAMASSFTRFLHHTQRRTTAGRTRLDEWSARRRDSYLYNTQHSKQTSMPQVGFEPTISAGKRPQTYALEHLGLVWKILIRETNSRFYYRDSMRFLLSYWDAEWLSGHVKGCMRLE
jgi:hypothetical protein